MDLSELYTRLFEKYPKIRKALDKIRDTSKGYLEKYDKRPYNFLILYDYYTARNLAKSLQEALNPYGRSFPFPPEDIEILPDTEIISLTSKTNEEQILDSCLIECKMFPRDIKFKELEEEIEKAVKQSKIVIPIITPPFLTSKKNLDWLERLEDKRIVTCIYEGYGSTEKFIEKLPEQYKKLLKNGIKFNGVEDLDSKVVENISKYF